jgi:hypothetical protein
VQQLQSFHFDLLRHHGDAGDVPAGPIEICNQTKLDGVSTQIENNGNGRCRRFCGHCRRRTANRNDHCNAAADRRGFNIPVRNYRDCAATGTE